MNDRHSVIAEDPRCKPQIFRDQEGRSAAALGGGANTTARRQLATYWPGALARETEVAVQGRVAVRAVVLVLRGRFRQYWKSWLALSVLIAVAGGFVMSAAAAGRRTAAAFPDYVARHGYDIMVYSLRPLPQLAGLPDVASVTPVLVPISDRPRCASCRTPIDTSNFLVSVAPLRQLPRLVTLLSGRMPHQSDPGEVLASFTLAQDNGVRIGSVIRVPLVTPSELATGRADRSVPRPALRVVGIIAAENEFPIGISPHYDLYATTALAAAVKHRAALLHLSYVRLRRGAVGLAGFQSRLRSLNEAGNVVGTDDLDTLAGEVQGSIRPQAIGWYVLAGLAALAALAVIGQAVARQAATERADHHVLSALGVQPREFVLLELLRALVIGTAGAAGAVVVTALLSPRCWPRDHIRVSCSGQSEQLRCGHRISAGWTRRDVRERQADRENGSPRLAGHLDMPAMGRDHSLHDRQAEAGASGRPGPGAVTAHETLEQGRLQLSGNARSVVAHAEYRHRGRRLLAAVPRRAAPA